VFVKRARSSDLSSIFVPLKLAQRQQEGSRGQALARGAVRSLRSGPQPANALALPITANATSARKWDSAGQPVLVLDGFGIPNGQLRERLLTLQGGPSSALNPVVRAQMQ